jgi:hypothetical protein
VWKVDTYAQTTMVAAQWTRYSCAHDRPALFGPWSRITTPIPVRPNDRLPDYPTATDVVFWGSITLGHEVYWGTDAMQLRQTTTFSTTDTTDQILSYYRTYAEQADLTIEEPSVNTCCSGALESELPIGELTIIRVFVDQESMKSGYSYTIRIRPSARTNWQQVQIQQKPWAIEIFAPH